MPETPNDNTSDFEGALQASVEHLLETTEDTPEALKAKLEYAKAKLKEETSGHLDTLREDLGLEEAQNIIIRDSIDARRELADFIGTNLSAEQLESGAEADMDLLLEGLTTVLEEELIEHILKVEDLKSLSVDELREMEKSQPGVLLFAFTTWGDKHKELDVSKLGNEYLPKVDDTFTIDFRGNEDAYWGIGAADLLPPDARGIKVKSENGEERISARRVGLKGEANGGFYDESGYIPIFTRDVITIHNVDNGIRDKYFDKDTGKWNSEEYDKDHPDDASYMLAQSVGDDGSLGSPSGLSQNGRYARSLDLLKNEEGEWFNAAESASEIYSSRFGVSIQASTVFAVIAKESAFDPEAVSSSGCTGLGQFSKATWIGFVRDNRSFVKSLLNQEGERMPVGRANILKLRTNPILNIYATTWYLSKIAKSIGHQSVDSNSIKEIYLCYHEGIAGKRTLENYINTGRGRLHPWQRDNPRAYWSSLNHYAGQVAAQTRLYEEQAADEGATIRNA